MFEIAPFVVGAVVGKVCCRCGEWKLIDQYWLDKRRTDGHVSACGDCTRKARRASYAASPKKYNERGKKYRESNKDRVRATCRIWVAQNADHVREYQRQYRAAHAEERRAYSREYLPKYRAANRERTRENERRRRATNPDQFRAKLHAHRVKRREAIGRWTAEDIEAIRKAQNNRCYICHKKLGKTYHIDHFIPIKLGGSNEPGNLRLACPHCNKSKGAKHPHDLGMLI